MVSLFASLSLVSAIILFTKINWTGKFEKKLYSLFWFALIGLGIGGFFSYFLGELLVIRLVLSTILFVSFVLLSFKIKYRSLSTFYKCLTVILHASNLILVLFSLFLLVFNNN